MLGSFLLGVVFALAFCPYSGALFFAMLIPMTLSTAAGLGLPVVFSIGTGLPVIFFAFVIAFSMEKLGMYFKAISKVENYPDCGRHYLFNIRAKLFEYLSQSYLK